MGLFSSVKDAVGMGDGDSGSSDDVAEEWIDEVESEVEESEDTIGETVEDEQEEEVEEWESAYKFAEEFLEVRGFASMVDFTNKCMAYKIDNSALYRDRISNGVDTMNRITTMQEQMRQIGGERKEDSSFEDKAKKLESANKVIDEAQKLSGQEDAMVNEIIGLGHEFADAIANNPNVMSGGGQVDSNVSVRDDEEL